MRVLGLGFGLTFTFPGCQIHAPPSVYLSAMMHDYSSKYTGAVNEQGKHGATLIKNSSLIN